MFYLLIVWKYAFFFFLWLVFLIYKNFHCFFIRHEERMKLAVMVGVPFENIFRCETGFVNVFFFFFFLLGAASLVIFMADVVKVFEAQHQIGLGASYSSCFFFYPLHEWR